MAKGGTLWLSRGYNRCTTYNQLTMSDYDVICSLKFSLPLWLWNVLGAYVTFRSFCNNVKETIHIHNLHIFSILPQFMPFCFY